MRLCEGDKEGLKAARIAHCSLSLGLMGHEEINTQRKQGPRARLYQFSLPFTLANFNTFAKPWNGKVASPKKKALKHKAPGSFPSAGAAVKPRTAFDADTMGPPAKKAAMVRTGANAEMDPL